MRIRCDVPRALVRADRADLDRVFMNLLSNAIKYNRDHGRIDVGVSDAADGWSVTIADTGIGMSEAEREGLFREFYRVKNERTAGIPGTGLGLVTVKRVLDRLRGEDRGRLEAREGHDLHRDVPEGAVGGVEHPVVLRRPRGMNRSALAPGLTPETLEPNVVYC